ncbi:hypothetical protein M3J09_007594 [Ascochyta lentis]
MVIPWNSTSTRWGFPASFDLQQGVVPDTGSEVAATKVYRRLQQT